MSGKGKRKEEEEYDSDGSVDGHAPPKKASKTDSSDDSDDIVVCEWNTLRDHVEEINKALVDEMNSTYRRFSENSTVMS
ncbi:hypothetical protein CUMW_109800 [Citrus unshiu]|nr:hypothetical protein CUMW_109800 [Citrus unshiu]